MPATPPVEDHAATRFDVPSMRRRAGEKVFERGEDYFDDGAVSIFSLQPERVLARVAGTEDYRVELTGGGKKIDGACSCPAFADWGFCKHMVAVALAANSAGADGAPVVVDTLGDIRKYLKQKDVAFLVETILGLAEHDSTLWRRLELAAAADNPDKSMLATQLRAAVDHATYIDGYIGYRGAADWAEEVDGVLDTIAGLATGPHGALALELAERVIDGVEEAIEEIDDSHGHCGGLLERARDIHLAAARASRPDPLELARNLFGREMEGGWGTFDGAMEAYADALGEEGLAEYRRLASVAWEAAESRSGGVRGDRADGVSLQRLAGVLDFFAEREGDLDTRIALRAKDLSSPWSYIQLVQFCDEHGRGEEALRRAEEGLWLFEDGRADERLVLLTSGLMAKAGRVSDAQACLRRAFEKASSFELYCRLAALGGETAARSARELLEARAAAEALTRWTFPADLLVRVLMHEMDFGAAWGAASRFGVSGGLKQTLARESDIDFPREALGAYAERVDELAGHGGNPAYEEAAALVVRMAGLRTAPEQAAYILDLKGRHGRKRNFMKLLG